MTNCLPRHHDPRADLRSPVEVDHVLVRHADAARRNRLPDRIRLIGAMNPIERAGKVHGARAERIVGSPLHMAGKVRPAPQHLWRWRPIGPFSLVADMGDAGPGKSWPSDADAVLERLMIRQDEGESTLPGADDDVPGASLPSNETVSRGIGEATGCNSESSALANTGAAPKLRKRPAAKAARIQLRRMISPNRNNDQPGFGAIRRWCNYGGRQVRPNARRREPHHELVNCAGLWRRSHIAVVPAPMNLESTLPAMGTSRDLDPILNEDFNDLRPPHGLRR